MTSRLLYVDGQGLAAWRRQGRQLVADGVFSRNDDDFRRFTAYLAEHRSSRYVVLSDLAGESRVTDNIPYLRSADRQALLARKLAGHFPGNPLTAAFPLGYAPGERKKETLLFCALTTPELIEPWLQRITQAEAALAGVYSVSQLGGRLLKKLHLGQSPCLLLTRQGQAIRESFLAGGETLFSRLVPLKDESLAGRFAAEAGRLQQHLLGQRLINHGEPLPVYILAHPQDLAALRDACGDNAQLRFTLVDNQRAADRIGLKTGPGDSRSERLFLQLLALSPPGQQFAAPGRRHDHRLANIRQAILAGGGACLLGALLISGWQWQQAETRHEESRSLIASATAADREAEEIAAGLPQVGLQHEQLRQLTAGYTGLRRQQIGPGPAYQVLSQALDAAPGIELDSLDWRQEQDKNTLTVHGHLDTPSSLPPRRQLAAFEHFVGQLPVDRSNSLQVLQRPFDLDTAPNLHGGDGVAERSPSAAFALRITHRPPP